MKRKAPYNSTHPKGGAPCSAASFVVSDNSVLRINFCGEIATFAKPENVICNHPRHEYT